MRHPRRFTALLLVLALLGANPAALAELLMLRQGLNLKVAGKPDEIIGWLAKGSIVEIPHDKVKYVPVRDEDGNPVGIKADPELTLKLWLEDPILFLEDGQLYNPITVRRVAAGSNPRIRVGAKGLLNLAALEHSGTPEKPTMEFVTRVDTPLVEPPPPGRMAQLLAWAGSWFSTPAPAAVPAEAPAKSRPALVRLEKRELGTEVQDVYSEILEIIQSKEQNLRDRARVGKTEVARPRSFRLSPDCGISKQELVREMGQQAVKIGIPVSLLEGMIHVESEGRCVANSRKGAASRGLFQIKMSDVKVPSCTSAQVAQIGRAKSASSLRPASRGAPYRPHCLENPILNLDLALRNIQEKARYFKDAGFEKLDNYPELKWRLAVSAFNGGQAWPIDAMMLGLKMNAASGKKLYDIYYWPDLVTLMLRRTIEPKLYANQYGDYSMGRLGSNAIDNVAHVESVFQASVQFGLNEARINRALATRTNAPLPNPKVTRAEPAPPSARKVLGAIETLKQKLQEPTGPAR